jgi:hypothetical protein
MVYEFLEKQISLYFQQLSLLIQNICGGQHYPSWECTLTGTENDKAGVKDEEKTRASLAVGGSFFLRTLKSNQVVT